MHIARFVSRIVERANGEGGYFEFNLDLDRKEIERSGDPRAFVMMHMKYTLAGLCHSHNMPVEMWTVTVDPRICSLTGLPEKIEATL